MPVANNPFGQPAMAPGMGGMGFGQQPSMWGQPQPQMPSKEQLEMMQMQNLAIAERFVAGPLMGMFVEMLNNLVSLSILEILRSATFALDEDTGLMTLDVTKLPSNLQTMSSENIVAQFNALQGEASKKVAEADNMQQQINAALNQNMMAGAFSAAMANPGTLEKTGTAVGNIARGFITGGR